MVILSQVRLHTLRLEDGDATARATVSESVLMLRLATVADTRHKTKKVKHLLQHI